MAGNLNISKSDTNLAKEDLIAQRISIIMLIIALFLFIVSDKPSCNYGFDPYMVNAITKAPGSFIIIIITTLYLLLFIGFRLQILEPVLVPNYSKPCTEELCTKEASSTTDILSQLVDCPPYYLDKLFRRQAGFIEYLMSK